jgi:hypothetical protein
MPRLSRTRINTTGEAAMQHRKPVGSRVRWRLVGALLSAAGLSGCGILVKGQVDAVRAEYPDVVGPLAWNGVADMDMEPLRCGPSGILTWLIPDCPLDGVCFTAACYDHDECYGTCGTSQVVCDGVFFWDLIYVCDAADIGELARYRCYNLAWIYSQAVHLYGATSFSLSQEIACSSGAEADAATAREASDAPTLAPFVDEDNDLMPDDWEVEMMLDPTDAGDAMLDYDGDGLVNLAEYVRETDPYVADDVGSLAF